jgi:hypothetical protein
VGVGIAGNRLIPRPTDLLGVWQLERRLVDRVAGQFGRVTGWLELTLRGSVVHWLELGELAWGDELFEVTRELYVVREGDGWVVRFTDGRLFHAWHPGETVVHPCGADLYRGLITLDSMRTRMRVLWDVTGPAKDQRIVTRCRRRRDVTAVRDAPGEMSALPGNRHDGGPEDQPRSGNVSSRAPVATT